MGRTASLLVVASLAIAWALAPAPPPAAAAECAPLPCEQVKVALPYSLGFERDHGGVDDRAGIGTGFTTVVPRKAGGGYEPARVAMDTGAGRLNLGTSAGIAAAASNDQANLLAVGIQPGRTVEVATTLVSPPRGTGAFEQGGLFLGNDQDSYVKLVVLSRLNGSTVETRIQLAMEIGGRQVSSKESGALSLSGSAVRLALRADPATGKVTASYKVGAGSAVTLGTIDAPAQIFSSDAAGIDPRVGTNTFGGIFATHRNGPASLTYAFDSFTVADVTSAPPPPPTSGGSFPFSRVALGGSISRPTAMAFGPDGRLYVTELQGKIHALTLGADRKVVSDQVIGSLGSRVTLGLAVDPASTASRVILWVAHSDQDLAGPSSQDGSGGAVANSGAVARITVDPAARTAVRTSPDPITGLPRSQANHATNGLRFGPVEASGRRRLYIAQSGNTGAGAPNRSEASLGEFGLREEQPLSAAILVADVAAAGFDGSCANTSDIYGPAPCSVTPYATGFRNAYDLTWHSNGSLYATDNGAAVGPTYPPSPRPSCRGIAPWPGNDTGTQNDLLLRVLPGRYYGHPNPSRGECVFKDGSKQGVAPLGNYTPPIADLGGKKSANGIIEYRSSAFGGRLRGSLLITNYSLGDDITRVTLSPDGSTVTARSSLIGSFSDPLPLVEGPDGTIYVGEFAGNRITALVPGEPAGPGPEPVDDGNGSWSAATPVPESILDASGAAYNGRMYLVGGKRSSGAAVTTVRAYNPASGAWSLAPALPGAGVENPAVVGTPGGLYAFGGSTEAFSGAQRTAAVFDGTRWTSLPAMPTARGGAQAVVLGGRIHVVGGMGADGASLGSVDVFDPAARTWSTIPAMGTRRDNLGAAVLGGRLYAFGGRTCGAGCSSPVTHKTVEAYDPATRTWSPRASMPTARRSVVVGTLRGRAQVMGGEVGTGAALAANEEYDAATNSWRVLAPMVRGRHGAAGATLGERVHVAGGGVQSGRSVSNHHEVFEFGSVPTPSGSQGGGGTLTSQTPGTPTAPTSPTRRSSGGGGGATTGTPAPGRPRLRVLAVRKAARGWRVKLRVSEPVRLTIKIRRGKKVVDRSKLRLASAGTATRTIGRKLRRGRRYEARIVAVDATGLRSATLKRRL